MNKIIEQFETAQMTRQLPDFAPGDTIVVNVKVTEGSRERLQAFEGVVIAKRNRGLHSAFTVRKMSHGTGVERVFQAHSPAIDSVEVKRKGKVRGAKLYYLRGLEGKAARIKEDITAAAEAKAARKPAGHADTKTARRRARKAGKATKAPAPAAATKLQTADSGAPATNAAE